MSALTDSLDQIVNWWRQNIHSIEDIEAEMDDILLPGLSREQIDQQIQDLPFGIAEEIYDLYQWHNGMYQPDCLSVTYPLFPDYAIYPLEQALRIYDDLISIRQLQWSPLWFPILYQECRSYYCTVGNQKDRNSAPIIHFAVVGREKVVYSSLTEMMNEIADRYERGTYYVEDGELMVEYSTLSSHQ